MTINIRLFECNIAYIVLALCPCIDISPSIFPKCKRCLEILEPRGSTSPKPPPGSEKVLAVDSANYDIGVVVGFSE